MQIAPSALESTPGTWRVGPPDGPSGPVDAPPERRRKPRRVGTLLLTMVVVATAGAAGVIRAADQQVDRIARIEGLEGVLSVPSSTVENFLLVGSDSREGADPSDPDFGAIGNEVSGNRSDTIMILRRDKSGGPASVLSLPRDLWLPIPGRDGPNRINAAYQDGREVLIRTITESLQIPIHHYVEIDFQGFKQLIDAIGGVRICFDLPARDEHTGFFVELPGCPVLDGVQGLAYVWSRHYQTYSEGEWHEDGRADLGRIERQQMFINTALQAAIAEVKGNPLKAGDVLANSTSALRIDGDLDVLDAATAMREAVGGGLQTFSPPVVGKTVNGNAVLLPADGFLNYIQYFNGGTNTPPEATS